MCMIVVVSIEAARAPRNQFNNQFESNLILVDGLLRKL